MCTDRMWCERYFHAFLWYSAKHIVLWSMDNEIGMVWYVIVTSVYVSMSAHNFIGLVLVWNEFHNVSLTKFSS